MKIKILSIGKSAAANQRVCFKILDSKGFSLLELLIVLTLSMILIGAFIETTICIERCITAWDRSLRRRQTMSASLFYMTKDIRMAGCNPMEEIDFTALEIIPEDGDITVGLEVNMDKRGSATRSRPDGDIFDPDEKIFFVRHRDKGILRRNGQPMALQINDNLEDEPLFYLEKEADKRLVSMSLTTGEGDEIISFSTAVYVRNQ